ncbi:hypothetical protein [Williamsia soli]|uniref:hypothetical protein n=1 Tax=Williamsia soli TaxID=364929 RepID=UPI001A9DDB1A|nr:hypothetical protein [Williamsia soli]
METVEAIFKVLVVGLLLGAGLPAIFAIGIRLHSAGSGEATDGTVTAPNPVLKGIAYLLFAIIAAVIVIGILWITRGTIDYYFGVDLFPFVES